MTLQPSLRFLTATAGASLLLASCAVGPKAPDATLPPSASGAFIGAASPAVSTSSSTVPAGVPGTVAEEARP